MPTLIACRRNTDFSQRKLVGETEKTPIRAGISAKPLLPQEIDGDEAANKQKRDGDRDRRKRRPKLCRHQMIRESRDHRARFGGPEYPVNYRPDEHLQRGHEWDIHQQARPKRLWLEMHFL